MTSRSTANIGRALKRKGFRESRTHHIFYELYIGGKPQDITTFLSHGADEYGDPLLARMAHQLHLNKRELLELVDCRMSENQYAKLLVARGILPREH